MTAEFVIETPPRRHDATPRRFKLTVGTDEVHFNHTVQIDTVLLSGKPVIHIVDMATHFCTASSLRSQSTKNIWHRIQSMWTLFYVGPPDLLSVDQVSAYISNEMGQNLKADGVSLIQARSKSR